MASASRRFELVEGTSNKFWEIEVEGSTVTTRYGRIGAAGQSTDKDVGSAVAAKVLHDKLVREKTGKGYVEVGGDDDGDEDAGSDGDDDGGDTVTVDLGDAASLTAAIARFAALESDDGHEMPGLEVVLSPKPKGEADIIKKARFGRNYRVTAETRLFVAAAANPKTRPAVVALVKQITAAQEEESLYRDEETPFGTDAALALALTDVKSLPLYIAFLENLDLDHEVVEGACMDGVMAVHGLGEATLPLLAARLTTCGGQGGRDQVEGWLGKKPDVKLRRAVLLAVVTYVRDYVKRCPDDGRPDAHHDFWIKSLREVVFPDQATGHFPDLLAPAMMEGAKLDLDALLDDGGSGKPAKPDTRGGKVNAVRAAWVKKLKGGGIPSVKMLSELGSDPEIESFIEETFFAPSVHAAPFAYWRAATPRVIAVARRNPAVRRELLYILPELKDERELVCGEWIALLDGAGTFAELGEKPVPLKKGTITAARWLSNYVQAAYAAWCRLPDAIYELFEELVPALKVAGEPYECYTHGYKRDLDLAERSLELGLAIDDAGGRFDLEEWANGAGLPGRHRDPVLIAAHPVLAKALTKSIEQDRERAWLATASAGMKGFASAGSSQAGTILANLTRSALPLAQHALEELAELEVGAFSDATAQTQLAQVSFAPALARSLSIGSIDELGWAALEDAVRDLGLAPRERMFVGGNFPVVVVATQKRAIAVGPEGRLGAFDLVVPAGAWLAALRFCDGQLLVMFRKGSKHSGYWSSNPKKTFAHKGDDFPELAEHAAFIDGGIFDGARLIKPGHEPVLEDQHCVHTDGKRGWQRNDDNQLQEVNLATGKLGKKSVPEVWTKLLGKIESVWYSSYLVPLPAGLRSPRESADGLAGVMRTDGDDAVLVGIDGQRSPERVAEADGGTSMANGFLRLPGDKAARLITSEGLVSPDGAHVGSLTAKAFAQGVQPGGTQKGLPEMFWHLFTPRDEAGSTRLRGVEAALAARLLEGAPPTAPKLGDDDDHFDSDDSDDSDGDDEPKAVAEDPFVTWALGRVAACLPEIKHAGVVRGVAGLVAQAGRMTAQLAQQVKRHTGGGDAAKLDERWIDISQLGASDVHGPDYRGSHDETLDTPLGETLAFFAGEDRTDRKEVAKKGVGLPWAVWLAEWPALMYLARAALATTISRRERVKLLGAFAGMTCLPGKLRVYESTLTTRPPKTHLHAESFRVWHKGNAYAVFVPMWDAQPAIVLEYAPKGAWQELPLVKTPARVREVTPIDAATLARIQALSPRPRVWTTDEITRASSTLDLGPDLTRMVLDGASGGWSREYTQTSALNGKSFRATHEQIGKLPARRLLDAFTAAGRAELADKDVLSALLAAWQASPSVKVQR